MSGFLLLFNTVNAFSVVKTGTGFGSASSSVTITGIPTSGVNLIVVTTVSNASSTAVTDTLNSYTVGSQHASTGVYNKVFYSANPTTTSSMTFSFNGTFSALAVMILTGVTSPTPSLDQQTGNNGTGASLSTGSVTPLAANEFVVACAGTGSGSSGTPPAVAGYNLINVPLSGSNQGLVTYWQIQSAATMTSVTFAGTSITYYGASIATFQN